MTPSESTPLVSVLIPLYNHAAYISRCLDSILEDGYPCVEIIIIDDGSKDNSAALAGQWRSENKADAVTRFELITRPNKGLTKTLNELVSLASGKYIALLASDDYLLPGGITARLEYLQSNLHKLAVFGDCIVVNEQGEQTHASGIADLYGGHIDCLVNDDLLATELIFNWCVPGPGFMATAKMYNMIGLYDESLTIEDWDMYLRIVATGKLGFVSSPVAAYRYGSGNSVLNINSRATQLRALIQTAWQNSSRFQGLNRFGLLYVHQKLEKYTLKKFTALANGRTVSGLARRMIYKLLYWLSPRRLFLYWLARARYKRIIAGLK